MPRITKAHMKESIVPFSIDVLQIINEIFKLNDSNIEIIEEKRHLELNNWFYYIHISTVIIKPEIHITRRNFCNKCNKNQCKGNNIFEEAWIYKEGANCKRLGKNEKDEYLYSKDHGYLTDGFSIQNYIKKVF